MKKKKTTYLYILLKLIKWLFLSFSLLLYNSKTVTKFSVIINASWKHRFNILIFEIHKSFQVFIKGLNLSCKYNATLHPYFLLIMSVKSYISLKQY